MTKRHRSHGPLQMYRLFGVRIVQGKPTQVYIATSVELWREHWEDETTAMLWPSTASLPPLLKVRSESDVDAVIAALNGEQTYDKH
jgi:hypothetical protein